MSSLSFDRAADFYDATRGLPTDIGDALTDLLAQELEGRRSCLEIGVGTGRIALPLSGRGVRLTGTDLSESMLRRLVQNAGNRLPFPLLIADTTDLPLEDGAVDAVLASHVLHLIPGWRAAVDEALRVLGPRGALLVDFGGTPPAPWHEWSRRVLGEHDIVRLRPGVSTAENVSEYLGERARTRALPPLKMVVRRSLGQDIDAWERQVHSWTWPYRADEIRTACAAIRASAEGAGWPLDEEVGIDWTIQWWAFDRAD
ncbi:MAG TPA: class I SAM-dependent methyltransferase [Acidimicrobiales bacterium]|jgi:ubiquinone/menaquinone biosynthesis C-methylase UbiE|nr:class I SAM-dependent methyltransferase [Acidimicrobiales bacterium]